MTSPAEATARSANPAHRRAPPRRPHSSRRHRAVYAFSLLVLFFASTYTGAFTLARVYPALFPGRTLSAVPVLGQLDRLPIGIGAPTDSVFNQRINLLVLGVDKRPQWQWSESDGYLTDTIMVATIDPVQKTLSILSFPRDMLITINLANGFSYEDRINTSYGVGVRNGKKSEDGINQLKLDLKSNFGITIDQWVILDFKGVEKLVDAVDGVTLDIPPDLAVPQWFYSDDDINGVWLEFPAGTNNLNGYQAVAFGRHREYDSDLKRVKRQQLVVTGAINKAFELGILNNPLGLWDAYSSTVKTDISRGKMPGYALLLKDTNGRMKTFSLGDPVDGAPTLYSYTTPEGAATLKWVPENVQYWLKQVFTASKYSASNVEVRDGYGGPEGQTRTAALGRYLAYSKALPTVYYGPDEPQQPRTTITLYGDSRRPLAEDLATWLGITPSAIVQLPKDEPTLPDIVLTVGKDFRLPGQ